MRWRHEAARCGGSSTMALRHKLSVCSRSRRSASKGQGCAQGRTSCVELTTSTQGCTLPGISRDKDASACMRRHQASALSTCRPSPRG